MASTKFNIAKQLYAYNNYHLTIPVTLEATALLAALTPPNHLVITIRVSK
ncbi:MAG: hypothetical protein ACI96W_002000 [Paraglaciecola sp.]|jgi:hypothetical protein